MRRALIASGALGASSLIAGCSGGGGGDGGGEDTTTAGQGDTTTTGTGQGTQTTGGQQTATETALADVSGQTLTWYTMQDVDKITWAAFCSFPGNTGGYIGWPSWFSPTWRLTMETNVRMGRLGNPPKLTTYENVDITPEEITIKVKDDAKWSNGDPITARDCIAGELVFRLIASLRSPEKMREVPQDSLSVTFETISDYEIVDDKTAKLISFGGKFDAFTDEQIYNWIRIGFPWGGARGNTAREPYKRWWETIDSIWTRYQNGEINPWTKDFSTARAVREAMWGPHGWSPQDGKNNYNQEVEKLMRKPENVHTSGAWDLKQFNGTKSVTLKPNEHYQHADRVNFDEIKVIGRSSQRANRAAMKANSQDYYRGDVPQYIANSFPDDIEQRLQPGIGGLAFGLDHRSKYWGKRDFRAAVMHAIDTKRVSRAVHRTKFRPITTPGAEAWGAKEILGEDWIKNNLITYEQRDTQTAAEHMQAAGFTKEGGKWVDQEGNTVSITIPTADTTPQLEPMFANQLSSFGIDASLQTYSQGVFGEKKNNGELDLWRTTKGLGFHGDSLSIWRWPTYKPRAKTIWRMYGPDDIKEANYAETGILQNDTPEGMKPFTIEAPPMGSPEGDLKEWHPATIATKAGRMDDDSEEYPPLLRKSSWLFNYFLPIIPIAQGQSQHFMDTAHWMWPATDDPVWERTGNEIEALPGLGYPQANPDNPESGASVQQ